MKLMSVLSILLVLLMVASCAKQMTTVNPIATVRVYAAPLETVGKVLLTLMAEYDLKVIGIEREEGIIRTDFTEFEADSDIGKAALQAVSTSEKIQKGRFKLNVFFDEMVENSVKVRIDCTVEKFAGSNAEANYRWQSQPSNGEIEKRVFARLEERLKKQGFVD